MLDIDKPMEAIDEWQKWYRENRTVRTSTPQNILDTVKDMSVQKAEEHFADTIVEFSSELSGKELYKAFYAAAIANLDAAEKEYQKAKQLVDMLRCNNVAP